MKGKVLQVDPLNPPFWAIEEAVSVIKKKEGVIIFPTDTVYGMGTFFASEQGVKKIYRIKRREENKPLIIFLWKPDDLSLFVKEIPPSAQQLIEMFWPGPLTIVFKTSPRVPPYIRSGRESIGIRIPNHPLSLSLLRNLDLPLATTSANISGRPSPTRLQDIDPEVIRKVDLVLDGGDAPGGVVSTVIDLTSSPPRILREGAIKEKDLRVILRGKVEVQG